MQLNGTGERLVYAADTVYWSESIHPPKNMTNASLVANNETGLRCKCLEK